MPKPEDVHDHDRGLLFDLKLIHNQMIERRRLLGLIGLGGGAALLSACGGGGGGASTSSTTTSTASSSSSTTSSSSASTSTSSSSTSSTAASGSCLATPAETPGPYPADGTNTSSGSTSDILTSSGIVRSDIRKSFISTTTDAGGVLVTFTITLVNTNNSCAPLSGYAIYFWQVDRNGEYSLYGAPDESYLRGVQVTDSNGQVTFITYFPSAYGGRWPHQHFEIYTSVSTATKGTNAILTSQFAMPEDLASAIYSSEAALYPKSTANLASVSESTDLVFSTVTAAQLAQMTPTFAGNVTDGYTETATIGIAV